MADYHKVAEALMHTTGTTPSNLRRQVKEHLAQGAHPAAGSDHAAHYDQAKATADHQATRETNHPLTAGHGTGMVGTGSDWTKSLGGKKSGAGRALKEHPEVTRAKAAEKAAYAKYDASMKIGHTDKDRDAAHANWFAAREALTAAYAKHRG